MVDEMNGAGAQRGLLVAMDEQAVARAVDAHLDHGGRVPVDQGLRAVDDVGLGLQRGKKQVVEKPDLRLHAVAAFRGKGPLEIESAVHDVTPHFSGTLRRQAERVEEMGRHGRHAPLCNHLGTHGPQEQEWVQSVT